MKMTQNQEQTSLTALTAQQSSLFGTENGFAFRDLNKNGKLDIYEDPRQPIAARIDDLLGQMTLAEKVGLLFINGARVNADGSIEDQPGAPGHPRVAVTQMAEQQMSHFNLPEWRPLCHAHGGGKVRGRDPDRE